MSIAADFDPYLEWLNIHPHERPADHYRMLGLRRFESRQDMIAQAADQRMEMLRQFQTGPRGNWTQQLLNEISAARICLLNPSTKATYDAVLQGQLAATADPPVLAPPAEKPFVEVEEENDRRTSRGSIGCLAVVVIAGAALIGGVIWGIRSEVGLVHELEPPIVTKSPNLIPPPLPPPVIHDALSPDQDGSFDLSASRAKIRSSGLHRELNDGEQVITGLSTSGQRLSWRVDAEGPQFYLFQITYLPDEKSIDGRIHVLLEEHKKGFAMRGGAAPGEFVTDEVLLLVKKTGINRVELNVSEVPRDGSVTFKSIRMLPR